MGMRRLVWKYYKYPIQVEQAGVKVLKKDPIPIPGWFESVFKKKIQYQYQAGLKVLKKIQYQYQADLKVLKTIKYKYQAGRNCKNKVNKIK